MSPTIFRKNGQWIFAGDGSSGIHARVEKLAEVFLQFEERGATRLLDRTDSDVAFEGALAKWHDTLVAILQDAVAA